LYHMEGMPPNLLDPPKGCRFHPRCPYVMDKCRSQVPQLTVIEGRQKAACFLYEEVKAREVVNG
ncbi:MAG: peptide ABC transporter ATP-binding protein, partial [Anaerolineales bacterium]